MNFKLKLWSLSLLLLIASISFEAKILAGDRTVAIEDSCMIGKDGKEIEASRKTIHRVTMPLKGPSTKNHLTFFHDGAPKSCTVCIIMDHPELAPIEPSCFKPASKVTAAVAIKPQAGAVATTAKPNSKDLATKDRDLLADNRRKQMFDYNLGRFHQAEMDRESCLKAAAIVGGGIIFVSVVRVVKEVVEAAKSARSR
jgi:hypothetical protein